VNQFANAIGEDLSDVPEIREILAVLQKLPEARPAIRDLLHAVLRLTGARSAVVLDEEDLSEVPQPTQLLWGAHDAFGGPEIGQRAAAALPNARLHVLGDGGHIPWVANPGRVGDLVVGFLREFADRIQPHGPSPTGAVAE
jgi:pimeloyl-ACP methyl ester carboxylesterase